MLAIEESVQTMPLVNYARAMFEICKLDQTQEDALGHTGFRQIKQHGYIETVAEADPHHGLTDAESPGEQGARELAGQHELDGFGRENSLPAY